jgi:hypothetical protein
MKTVQGFGYAELVFDKEAKLVGDEEFDALLAAVAEEPPADVLVFVHGWNNDIKEARQWYDELAAHFKAAIDDRSRTYILGVLWPSKKWAERALIAGGVASATGDADSAAVIARLEDLKGFFDADDADQRLDEAKALVPELENDPDMRDEFVDKLRGLLRLDADDDPDDFPAELVDASGREVLDEFQAPVEPEIDEEEGGAAGGASFDADDEAAEDEEGGAVGLGFLLTGFTAGAERALNLTTYYQMKQRAGLIGVEGLNPALRKLRAANAKTRLHLVGHSFGGRLVTAATVGRDEDPGVEPDTVTLVQAAFSHYGFAERYRGGTKDGFFRRLIADRMTRGPVLITHSKRDMAVGYAYPLASRLAGQDAAGLGDENSRFGGIGRNGAQDTKEAQAGSLLADGGTYTFERGKLYNLNADDIIRGHSDIRRAEVARAVVAAIKSVRVP